MRKVVLASSCFMKVVHESLVSMLGFVVSIFPRVLINQNEKEKSGYLKK